MALASGASVGLSYVAETTRGTTPATPTMKALRATSRNINLTKNMLESAEVDPTRQTRDIRHGFNQVQGSVGFELGLETYDDWLAAALGGTWVGDVLKVGNVLQTFTVERRFTDIGQYQVFRGVAVNTMSLTISPEAVVGGTFELIGMRGEPMSPTSLGEPTPAPTNSPFASFDGSLKEGGTEIAVVTSLELQINNNRSLQGVVGSKFSPDVFEGTCQITGTLSAFFESAALLDKFTSEIESSLEVTLTDINGAGSMSLLLPRIKYTGGSIELPQSGPITVSMPFTALYDSTAETSIQITRSIT